MKLAIIGMGRMGANIARRLARDGHHIIAYNRTPKKAFQLAKEEPNIKAIRRLEEVKKELAKPRIIWVMLPAGDATERMINTLSRILSAGDTIVDGGNSHYKDTIRRANTVKAKRLNFVDVGTSGGIWGLTEGYSMMVGGEPTTIKRLRPLLKTLAPNPTKGWGHVGPTGAGHFVKMVHNGIEYGIMEAYAEGFELLKAKKDFNLNLEEVAQIWQHGSVIRSWLLDLTAAALSKDQTLAGIKGWVEDSGEGRWTVAEAIETGIPTPAIAVSLFRRYISRQEDSYATKLLAAMRREFGGHEVKRAK